MAKPTLSIIPKVIAMKQKPDNNSKNFLRCPLEEINILDPELLQEPHTYYDRLRDEAPIFTDPKTGIVSIATYELIKEANSQPSIFSNDISAMLTGDAGSDQIGSEEGEILSQGWPIVPTLLSADPPIHTRYRKLVAKAFTSRRVNTMEDSIADLIDSLLEKILPKGECAFKLEFANLLPMYVIIDSLGAPREDIEKFRRWSDATVTMLGGVSDKAVRLQAFRDIVEFQHYLVERIEEKRSNPTEDIISDLVHADLAEEGDSRKMDYSELLSIFQQILVAGNESTANTLAEGLYRLIQNPSEMNALVNEPSQIKNFVEENLRLASPATNLWRMVKTDTTIGGVELKAGTAVLLRYGSANRDSAQFNNGQELKVNRENAKSHIAFGYGIHACIGSQLARKELNLAYTKILEKMTNIKISPKQAQIKYEPNLLVRGLSELEITFDLRK